MKTAALLALIALSGCGPRFEAARTCQRDIGPRPYAGADAFGAAGALWAGQQPERQVWYRKLDACVAERAG